MARPVRFSSDDILDGTARTLALRGKNLTMSDIAQEIGGPTGSIYHRFASREELLATLWIRSIKRFHVGLITAYTLPDPDTAIQSAAVHVVTFCRDNPQDALAMTLFRQTRLANDGPDNLRSDVAHINDSATQALSELAIRRFDTPSNHHLELLTLATRQCPYGLVRPHIGSDIPTWLDAAAATSAAAIAKLGDEPSGRRVS
ncbi:TetR/AcrR family transcriptional regulator [Corynebacterium durum]|jgi:putative transcriptional regulator|uniref:TetR/AcrR family transcriptional regulator n=1 Tax=Corynebacterium durum TaxID=61592 RepID=UPI0026DCF5A4|nr:TetR/AcrR family transcriptional regulator [Corynebacterium durum]MDO4651456.1 TetR/AcrR family transcriptional regulator [Corynebacterium durum]